MIPWDDYFTGVPMNPSTDKDREVWGRYLAAYREAHPNAGIPGACLTIDALRVFERNARSSFTAIDRNRALDEAVTVADAEWVAQNSLAGSKAARKIADGIRALKGAPVPESETIKEGK